MMRILIFGFIALTSVSALADDEPCQALMTPAATSGCLLIADHPIPQANDRSALELYRRGLARASKGESYQAFGDFNHALELDPGLSVAY